MKDNSEEIMLDLLYKQAVYGLSEEETKHLSTLENNIPNLDSFELTVAAIAMIDLKTDAELPADLRARILADAEEYFSSGNAAAQVPSALEAPTREFTFVESKARRSIWPWLGWAVAAAACVALAVNLYWTKTPTQIVENPVPTPVQEEKLTPALQRQRLLDSNAQMIVVKWGKGYVEEIGNVTGDVVWSDLHQEGYLRLNGLPVNDPNKETYQLWIFDESQDAKTPIDGGTFNIETGGEIIIPINARLKARNPKMFAVTIEKPGGVVVSKQEKVAVVAKRET